LVYDIEVVSLITLLNDDLASMSMNGEHGIKDITVTIKSALSLCGQRGERERERLNDRN
jgi:hypothetical protein